jgi:hypothetical protein
VSDQSPTDDSRIDLLSAADDAFHPPTDHPWFFESSWWSFYVPERNLGAWIYHWVRPNQSTQGGGCWLYDDTTYSHLEVPYYACYANMPADDALDLRDITFPSGLSMATVEPLQQYRLRFADRELIAFDLDFDATMAPWVGAHGHFDQMMHVTGELVLHGESIVVDSIAMRDRSWSPRPERWKDGHIGYCSAGTDDVAFLVNSAAGIRRETTDRVRAGFYLRDGRRAALVDGTRVLERDAEHGYLREITVEAEDASGRRFVARGEGLSRMAMPIPGVHGVCWTTLVHWTIDGVDAWGDDQDAWPLHGWAAFRRGQRASRQTEARR